MYTVIESMLALKVITESVSVIDTIYQRIIPLILLDGGNHDTDIHVEVMPVTFKDTGEALGAIERI